MIQSPTPYVYYAGEAEKQARYIRIIIAMYALYMHKDTEVITRVWYYYMIAILACKNFLVLAILYGYICNIIKWMQLCTYVKIQSVKSQPTYNIIKL